MKSEDDDSNVGYIQGQITWVRPSIHTYHSRGVSTTGPFCNRPSSMSRLCYEHDVQLSVCLSVMFGGL